MCIRDRFSTWRRLWLSLAKAELALGLPITQEQVDEMAAHLTDIDYDVDVYKRQTRSGSCACFPSSTARS